jgi:tetratricopeptide (TPR) repeat protein
MKIFAIFLLMICFSVGQAAAATNEEAIAAYQQGKAAMERSAPQEAIPFLKSALDTCTALGIDPCRTINLDELGNAYAMLERYGEALEAFQLSLSIKKRSGAPPERIIRTLNDVGQAQYFLKKHEHALASFGEGLEISRSLDIKGATAMLLEGSGMVQFASNNLSLARESFEESLRLQRELGYPGEETVRNLNNLGAVHMSARQYGQALPYFEEALTLFRKMNLPEATATGLNNLGYALAQLSQHERAMGYYEEALAIRKKHTSPLDTSIVLNNMGLLAHRQARRSRPP